LKLNGSGRRVISSHKSPEIWDEEEYGGELVLPMLAKKNKRMTPMSKSLVLRREVSTCQIEFRGRLVYFVL